MPEGLGNKKGEGEGGRERKAKVLKSPKSTGERWECGARLGSLAFRGQRAPSRQRWLRSWIPSALGEQPISRRAPLARKGNSCPRPPPLRIRSARGWKKGRAELGPPWAPPHPRVPRGAVPCWDAWLSPSSGRGCSPARPAEAIKISFPSLGKPQPEPQPNPGDISQRRRPWGRTTDF